MVARNTNDGSAPCGGWHPKRIAHSLHDQHRRRNRVQLANAALAGIVATAGRVQREGETQDGHRSAIRGSTAGHSGACGASSEYKRGAAELASTQLRNHLEPGRIELASGRLAAPTRDPVGLFDQSDSEIKRRRGARRSL